MASEQPFKVINGRRQNISFPASSIEMNNGATAQSTIESLAERLDNTVDFYGVCSTTTDIAAKEVNITGFKLETGVSIKVKFANTNTAASPTLNINSTGAKAIYYRGTAITAEYLVANRTYEFVYNGTQYELVGDLDTNINNATAQNISTANATYPILLGATANATANIGNEATLFSAKAKLNPSTAQMTLNNKVVPVVSSFDSSTGTLNLVSSGS